MAGEASIVAGRSCGGCTMCCKLTEVEALEKPLQVWCTHCDKGAGCRIYEQRPQVCREYFCAYMLDSNLGEEWKPARSRMVVNWDPLTSTLGIQVDKDRANAWRQEPYYSQIKGMARAADSSGSRVLVAIGHDITVILPDRDVHVGLVRDDQFIISTKTQTSAGLRREVVVVDSDDPRAAPFKAKT